MLVEWLAAGCASMSRQALETWKHLSSASWASRLGYWRWAPVFLAVLEMRMDFWMVLSTRLSSSCLCAACWIPLTRIFWGCHVCEALRPVV